MKTQQIKSKRLEGVMYRGAMATKKPSTITFVVDHRAALEASDLFEDIKAGNDRQVGLISAHAVFVYEDGQQEIVDVELGEPEDPDQMTMELEEDGESDIKEMTDD